MHRFAIREEKLPGFAELSQTGGLAGQTGGGRGGGLRLDEQGIVRRAEVGADRGDLRGRKDQRAALVMEVAKEGVLAASLRVAAPGVLELTIGREHRIGARAIGGGEPSAKQRRGVGGAVLKQLGGQPQLRGVEGPHGIGFGVPAGRARGTRGPDGLDERGQVDARGGDLGSVEVVVDADAAGAGLRPGGDIRAILLGEGRVTVTDAFGADPREHRRADRDRGRTQGLHVRQGADRMPFAAQVALGRPDGVGDAVEESHDLVGADRAIAEPALDGGGVIEVERVVHAERNGEGVGVLPEIVAGETRADRRGLRVIEARVGLERGTLGLGAEAVDRSEERRVFLPDLAVEGAVEPVGEFRRAPEADRAGPVERKFVESAELAPAEVRAELVGGREAQLITRRPLRALRARHREEDAEVLLAETAYGDARGGGIVTDEIDGAADDGASGGVALGDRGRDTGELGADGIADIDRQLRTADAFGLVLDLRADAGHAFAPIGERPGGMPLIDLGVGGHDDRGPAAGVEQPIGPKRRSEEEEAEERQGAGHSAS